MVEIKRKTWDIIDKILTLFLIIFGIFLIYQTILFLIGGSWEFESIIVGLLVLLITFMFKINTKIDTHLGEFKQFKISFKALAKDFKNHIKRR